MKSKLTNKKFEEFSVKLAADILELFPRETQRLIIACLKGMPGYTVIVKMRFSRKKKKRSQKSTYCPSIVDHWKMWVREQRKLKKKGVGDLNIRQKLEKRQKRF